MKQVKIVSGEMFYGISLNISAVAFMILKYSYPMYRLIPFGFAIGLFVAYIFEELNLKWISQMNQNRK